MIAETIFIAGFVGLLVLLLLWAKSLVWQFPGYRQFRHSMERVESAKVTGTRRKAYEGEGITLKSFGERRVEEIIVTSLGEGFDMRIVRCFGAMFVKEEAIAESIWRLQFSCGIAVGALLGGAVWFICGDVAFQDRLASAGRWEILPLVWERLRSGEVVMYAEIVSAALAVVTIVDAGRLLAKLNKEVVP